MAGILTDLRAPTWKENTPVSATELNTLADITEALDAVSYYGTPAFHTSYERRPNELGRLIVWRGGFVRSVATNLRIVYVCSTAGRTLTVKVNNASTTHTTSTGTNTIDIDISGLPPFTNSVFLVNITIDQVVPTIYVVDAYVNTIQPATSWPGVPTFGDISLANMQQLSDAATWLLDAYGKRVIPLFQGTFLRNGPVYQRDDLTRWQGTITKTADMTDLEAWGQVQVQARNTNERVRLYINGSQVDSYTVPATLGRKNWTLSADISGYTNDTRLNIIVRHEKLSPGRDVSPNRFSVERIEAQMNGGTDASITRLDIKESLRFDDLQIILNDIATALDDIYSRYTANSALTQRQMLYSARTAKDDEMFEAFEPGGVARGIRVGDALIARGEGISIGYGGLKLTGELNSVRIPEYEHTNNYNLTEESTSTVTYFEQVDGLPVGAPYFVRGVNAFYAGESLRLPR
jgi:hypothetical protein